MICLIYIISILLTAAAAKSLGPALKLRVESGPFVENEVAKFNCTYRGAQANVTLRIFVRDPTLNGPMFTAPSNQSSGQRSLQFDVRMRRDFSGKTLVCHASDGAVAELRIPVVRRTIPTNVQFSLMEYMVHPGHGNFLELCCNVSNNSTPTKVFLIEGYTNFKTEIVHRYKSRFCFPKSNLRPVRTHTGWPMVCLAKSADGEVYSEAFILTVYDPRFDVSATPLPVFLEAPVTVSVVYNDLQPPLSPLRTFQVCKVNKTGACPLGSIQVQNVTVETLEKVRYHMKVTNLKGGRFLHNFTLRANVTFVPQGFGRYDVVFVIKLRNNFVNRNLTIVGQRYLLTGRYERLLTPQVSMGAFAGLVIRFNASKPLRLDQLSLSGPTGAVVGLRFSVNHASYAQLEFPVCDSGDYRVAFRGLQAGQAHKIQVEEPLLNTSSEPIKKQSSDVVWALVKYSALQPPAFPKLFFKVFEVDQNGSVVSTNVQVLDVTVQRTDAGKFEANISFAPRGNTSFQVFLKCGSHLVAGPRIDIEPQKKVLHGNGWKYFVFILKWFSPFLVFFISKACIKCFWSFYQYLKSVKTRRYHRMRNSTVSSTATDDDRTGHVIIGYDPLEVPMSDCRAPKSCNSASAST